MKQSILKMYIRSWNDKTVECDLIDGKTRRGFDINPLFKGYEMFKGKVVFLTTTIQPGTMNVKLVESTRGKLDQKFEYLKFRFFKFIEDKVLSRRMKSK